MSYIFKNAILSDREIKDHGLQVRLQNPQRAFNISISAFIRGYKATRWPETVGYDYCESPEPLVNRAIEAMMNHPKGSGVIVSTKIDISKIRIPDGCYVKCPGDTAKKEPTFNQ